MKDKYGREIKIGDTVISFVITGEYKKGRVAGFYRKNTIKGFHVRFPNENYGEPGTPDYSPGDFIASNEAVLFKG